MPGIEGSTPERSLYCPTCAKRVLNVTIESGVKRCLRCKSEVAPMLAASSKAPAYKAPIGKIVEDRRGHLPNYKRDATIPY